jgi:hypothetical protein
VDDDVLDVLFTLETGDDEGSIIADNVCGRLIGSSTSSHMA